MVLHVIPEVFVNHIVDNNPHCQGPRGQRGSTPDEFLLTILRQRHHGRRNSIEQH